MLCYKKSFLSYSIFNLREPNNSSALTPSRGEPVYYNKALFPLSSIFDNFFRFYSEFSSVFRYFVIFSWTACLFYHIRKYLSTIFRNIFSDFQEFFSARLLGSLRETACISYHFIFDKSTVFSPFFAIFFGNFSPFFHATICCVFTRSVIQY